MTLANDLESALCDPGLMTDEEIDRRVGEILASHPPEKDHELSDRPPGPGTLFGNMSERDVMQRVRAIYERHHRRVSEPTPLREGK